jgi:sialic acid synthase SpsE
VQTEKVEYKQLEAASCVITEKGFGHNRSPELAKKLIDVAVKVEADAFKPNFSSRFDFDR